MHLKTWIMHECSSTSNLARACWPGTPCLQLTIDAVVDSLSLYVLHAALQHCGGTALQLPGARQLPRRIQDVLQAT